MLKLTSKTGLIKGSQTVVYNYISDFRNFAHLLPAEQLHHVKITDQTLEFGLDGLGNVGMQIAEKHPYDRLAIKAIEGTAANFAFTIFIDEAEKHASSAHIILEAQLNMFLEMMASAPLQRFLDLIIDKLSEIDFAEKV
jgi:hypothetical protein